MRICFWNTNKNKSINPYLIDIVRENHINFLILAEYEDDVEELINALGQYNINFKEFITIGCDRIKILAEHYISDPGFQNTYCSIQLVNKKYIFVCVHLPSKTHTDFRKKRLVIEEIMEEVHSFEKKLKIKKTLFVGDFNENPYEDGCLGASGFHGIPSLEETLKNHYRVILEKKFTMYYNPMWNLMGDFSFPPGTYYYSGNDFSNPLWNMYDQVIISPELKEDFVDKELKIIYKTKSGNLITKKNHPLKRISDHLPLVFEIKEG